MVLDSESTQAGDNFSLHVMNIRRQLKQRHVMATCEGIRVSVPISGKCSDIK